MSLSDDYRKLIRLKNKRKQLDRRIALIERKLQGKKHYWGGCSRQRKRRKT